mmetsp:Transcript_17989/g.50347  ORF Transcript_17989/g.50347 Transcript_17989/m.50347 type:complete len:167 (+) Transcript_17989:31-531(+)
MPQLFSSRPPGSLKNSSAHVDIQLPQWKRLCLPPPLSSSPSFYFPLSLLLITFPFTVSLFLIRFPLPSLHPPYPSPSLLPLAVPLLLSLPLPCSVFTLPPPLPSPPPLSILLLCPSPNLSPSSLSLLSPPFPLLSRPPRGTLLAIASAGAQLRWLRAGNMKLAEKH